VETLNLSQSNFLGLALQRHNCGSYVYRALASMEALHFSFDQRLGIDSLAAALFHMRYGNLLQVINVINEDAIKLVHRRINVARHCDIYKEHGAVAAALQKRLAVFWAEDVMRCPCGADHDIGAACGLIQILKSNDARRDCAFKLFSHAAGTLVGSVGDKNGGRSLLNQVSCGELAHLASPYQEDGAPLQRSEDLARHVHGHRSN
jgi:hypothetical protein